MTHRKMDWLRLEARIREALSNYCKDRESGFNDGSATLFLIDEILSEETGRGHSIVGEDTWED